jgi:hypothetical protein
VLRAEREWSQADVAAAVNLTRQVSVVTRSGGNNFHGSAYEFFQNDKLNARNPFDVAANPKSAGIRVLRSVAMLTIKHHPAHNDDLVAKQSSPQIVR